MMGDIHEQHTETDRTDPSLIAGFTFDEFAKSLASESEDVRAVAAGRLAIFTDPRAIPILIRTIADPSPLVRSKAALGLGRHRVPQSRDTLIDHLRNDKSGEVRAMCVIALGNIGGMYDEIIGALTDPDQMVKKCAMAALRNNGIRASIPFLKPLLDDEEWSVKYLACFSMMTLGTSNAKVVETLSSLREIPTAVEFISNSAISDVLIKVRDEFPKKVESMLKEGLPPSEILNLLRREHGETFVPLPSADPVGDLVEQARELCDRQSPS